MSLLSKTREVGSFLKTNVEIAGDVLRAAGSGATSPYHYMKPIILRAAEIGEPPLGPTPYEVVYAKGQMRLLHYAPKQRKYDTPILFIYSLINRWYILDFLPGRSLIEFMVNQGFDVYAIDWGTPGSGERQVGWDDVVNVLIKNAVKWTLRKSGAKDLTMYGYCMGGTMALAYAALHSEGLRNFVAQATPVDFHEGGVFKEWTKPERFDVDALVDAYGNVPIQLMETGFSSMAPVQRMTKWLEVFRKIDDKDFVMTFVGMEHWAADNVEFPGEIYRQYIKDCYQYNNFCNARMEIAGRTVNLGNIECSLLNIIAENDPIAPPKSSEILNKLVQSTDTELMRFPVGHIGLSTSSKGPKTIWPKVAGWIAKRSEPMK